MHGKMQGARITAAIALLLYLLGAGQVLADCYYNGKRVSEGTRIGVIVCEHGRWVERP